MKKITLYIFYLAVSSMVYAQVGIRSLNPIGIFHIDGLGNTSSSPTTSELTDDIIIQNDATGGVGVGIGKIPSANAQLDLQSTSKGFTLNKVALSSPTDVTTVPLPRSGMLVYNTNTNTSASISEGVFFHNNSQWLRVDTNTSLPELTLSTLLDNTPTTTVTSTSSHVGTALLKFTSTDGAIKVPSTSAYAFCIRLYGSVPAFTSTATNPVRHYYIYLVKKSDLTILDSAELDLSVFSQKDMAYMVTLGASLQANDEVYIYLGNAKDHPVWTLYGGSTTSANLTSLIYWKI